MSPQSPPSPESSQPSPPRQEPPPPAAQGDQQSRRGLGAVLQEEEFSVAAAIGGPRGIAESVLPTLVFVVLYVTTRSVPWAAGAAVGVVLVMLLLRLVQRQSLSTVIGGLLGVGIGAVLAVRTGDGEDFYTPGIITNAVACVVTIGSIPLGHPLVGVIVGMLDPRVAHWREDAVMRRIYTRATWLFAALYGAKVAVQLPLLLTGQVPALGVAKIAMGLPAFAVITYLVWLMHRSVLRRLQHE